MLGPNSLFHFRLIIRDHSLFALLNQSYIFWAYSVFSLLHTHIYHGGGGRSRGLGGQGASTGSQISFNSLVAKIKKNGCYKNI